MLQYLETKFALAVWLIFLSNTSFAEPVNPFSIMPFAAPEDVNEVDKSYRSKWRRLSGFELSGLHWNMFVVVYTNLGAKAYRHNFIEFMKALEAESDDEEYTPSFEVFPVGTVMLKENYLAGQGKPGKPTTLTIMIKHKKGYSPGNGDWEYIESDISGKILLRGKASDPIIEQRCSNCHNNIASRDFIFSSYFTDFKSR